MNIVISDFLVADCELTSKSEVECVRVRLDDASPEAVIATSELVRLLRFQKKQNDKQAHVTSKEASA